MAGAMATQFLSHEQCASKILPLSSHRKFTQEVQQGPAGPGCPQNVVIILSTQLQLMLSEKCLIMAGTCKVLAHPYVPASPGHSACIPCYQKYTPSLFLEFWSWSQFTDVVLFSNSVLNMYHISSRYVYDSSAHILCASYRQTQPLQQPGLCDTVTLPQPSTVVSTYSTLFMHSFSLDVRDCHLLQKSPVLSPSDRLVIFTLTCSRCPQKDLSQCDLRLHGPHWQAGMAPGGRQPRQASRSECVTEGGNVEPDRSKGRETAWS